MSEESGESMDVAPVDQDYNTINNALSALITSARMDSAGNLQNKNVLMEGFYREFLNILYGWKLVNANAERQNMPGIDLIDQENRVVAQVSATCTHRKIQGSLDKFTPPDDSSWHFVFIPIKPEVTKPENTFNIRQNVTFDPQSDILDGKALLEKVQHADNEVKLCLVRFLQLEKVSLWNDLNQRLRETRDNHPSFMLMAPDELDKQLYPHIKDAPALLDAYGKNSEGEVCLIWEIIRASWREPENRPIVIEGAGGIGKTVALFSIADAEDRYCPAPAIYVPMHRLVKQDGRTVDLFNFFQKISPQIDALAKKPWDGGPQLLVLLDGFNEVPAAKQRDILEKLKDWHEHHQGAQFIAVSRPVDTVNLGQELSKNTISIELQPIERETARAYLIERGIMPPADEAEIWNTLVLPLFLTLYVKTDGLATQTASGYPLAVKPPESNGALIWNYLQRELLRKKNSGESSETWVMRCAIACEYILPYIAFRMEREHRFTLQRKEARALIKEVLDTLDMEKLPRHLTALANIYDDTNDFSDLRQLEWSNTVLHDIGLLIKDKKSKDIYTYIHQHFRDALAGLYLVNQAEMPWEGDELPEVWRRAANYDVMNYAAELMEKPEAARLWEANRLMRPTDSSATYAMLELQRRRSDGTASTLDFSGMDLRGTSLVRYMREKYNGERDMKLFQKQDLSTQTRFDIRSFRSQGHTHPVSCVAVTKDGLCVSGAMDKTLRVWDLHTGECLRVLRGHTKRVKCVAVTEDGLCVSGAGDNSLWVWNLHTGERLHILEGHTNQIKCVVATEDGFCVSGALDKTLRVWDLHTGQCRHILEGHDSSVMCVALTKGGQCVSGAYDGTLRVWNLQTGKCICTLCGHTAKVNYVAIAENELCVSGSDDCTLRVWNWSTGDCCRIMYKHPSIFNYIAITKDELFIRGSSRANTLQVWDWYADECLHILEGHTDRVNCVAVAEDGLCVSGSWDSSLRVWDWRTGKCLRVLEGYTNLVTCVAVVEDGLCISGSVNNSPRVWDWRSGECLHELVWYTNSVSCIAVAEDGLCISGSGNNSLRVWNWRSGKCLRDLEGHTNSVSCIAMTQDGLCISGSYDKTLRVWNLNSGKYLRTLEGHTDCVTCVAATGDGRCVSGSLDNTLRVWDLNTGKCLRTLEGHIDYVTCVAATGDGRCISGSDDKTMQVWDLDTGECLRVLAGHTSPVNCVDVTEDGLCVSGAEDGTLRVWDLRTGECLRVLKGHAGSVNCIAVTKDGRCISGSWDETLRVWDIHTGKCLDIWHTMETDVSKMDFSKANLTPSLSKALWQHHAIVPKADSEKYARRGSDEA